MGSSGLTTRVAGCVGTPTGNALLGMVVAADDPWKKEVTEGGWEGEREAGWERTGSVGPCMESDFIACAR